MAIKKNSAKSSTEETFAEKKIHLSIQQVLTYSVTLITIGASIYTLFKALPKIEMLDEKIQMLKENNAKIDQRITDLKEILSFPGKHL